MSQEALDKLAIARKKAFVVKTANAKIRAEHKKVIVKQITEEHQEEVNTIYKEKVKKLIKGSTGNDCARFDLNGGQFVINGGGLNTDDATQQFLTVKDDGFGKSSILASGKVGIGTTSPVCKLHVAGAIHLEGEDIGADLGGRTVVQEMHMRKRLFSICYPNFSHKLIRPLTSKSK